MPLAPVDYEARFRTAAQTEKWAHAPYPRWHFLSFPGPDGGESRGVVDLLAVRKDHSPPREGLKRGDIFQIVLIQVKGGYAARPTAEDGNRLRKVARLHHAHGILLASWKRGTTAKFYTLRPKAKAGEQDWVSVEDLKTIFC